MNRKLLPWTLFTLFIISSQVAPAQGTAYNDPAAIGEQVRSVVQVGPMNTSNYDVMITLLETKRGEEAMTRLQAVDAASGPPKAGFEYLLAHIRFELQGRAPSDQEAFTLGNSPFQWLANSADFRQYDSVSVTPPGPVLEGSVRSGESVDGWLVFEVEQKEKQPIMTFDPSSGAATGRGNILFFKLY